MKTLNKIAMILAGIVLMTAAFFKVHQLLTEPIISKGFWESWLFYLMIIPIQLGLGIWLCSGLFVKVGWLLGIMMYGVFFIITLYRAITGAASCGCFGTVEVNPWVSLFSVDVPILLLMLIFRPTHERFFPPPWPKAEHFLGVAIPTFVILLAIVALLVFNKPPEKTDKYEVVKPEDWKTIKPVKQPVKDNNVPKITIEPNNQQPIQPKDPNADKNQESKPPADVNTSAPQWEMLKSIDITDQLKGDAFFVVVLYHYDCPDCREAIIKYDQIAKEQGRGEETIRFVFIEVPPYGPAEKDPVPPDTPCLRGNLADKKWIFQTPIIALIDNGSLIRSWQVEAPDLEKILDAISSGG